MLAPNSQAEPKPLVLSLVASEGSPSRFHAFVERHVGMLLRVSLGVVFFWFGILKLFPGVSPAEHLAGETLSALTFGLVKPVISLPLLGLFEMALGIAVLSFPRARFTIPLLLLHLAGTATPLALFPHETFTIFPGLTIVGQYIIKNLVLAAAALAILTAPAPPKRA